VEQSYFTTNPQSSVVDAPPFPKNKKKKSSKLKQKNRFPHELK